MKHLKSYLVLGVLTATVHCASAQTIFNPFPSRIAGQPFLQQTGLLTSVAPNLVEGRELFGPQSITVDNSVTPPILYVADTFNNRVLAWKNALGFQKGDFADLVIGQRDRYSTVPQGPGTSLSTGLFRPTGVAVDAGGNLYVADTGNNRILRYPAPFQQTTQLFPVDLVIGQPSLTSGSANQGLSTPTEKTLSISNQFVGMTFDSNGNLWVSDSLNNRVLRYPASELGSQPTFDPPADTVIGQPDFVSTNLPKTFNVLEKDLLQEPGAMAFSPSGLLFVSDSATGGGTQGRILVYRTLTTGASAERIMGVIVLPTKDSPPPTALVASETFFFNPSGIFFIGSSDAPFVVDTGKSRILQFDPYSSWPAESVSFSPLATKVYGQPGFEVPGLTANQPNNGNGVSGDDGFGLPTSAVLVGTDLIVSDSGNNRILAIPQFPSVTQQSGTRPLFHAARVVGQLDFKYNSVNLIDGREVSFSIGGGGVALDLVSATEHLYIADAANNRVLGFNDARTVQPGQHADIVIGQPDFMTGVRNYPSGVGLSDSSLSSPEGVAVDSKGDLWVADTGNGRVLRFPRPFDQPSPTSQRANLVIGQGSFTTKITDPSSQTMSAPYALAFTADGHMVVSDVALNRVLFFHKPSGGDFVNGQAAINVFGQPDFIPGQSIEPHPMNGPRGIAVDPNFDRMYVADSGNNQILVYPNVPTLTKDQPPSFAIAGDQAAGFNHPVGVAVDQFTGELWVTDTSNDRIVRFPSFDTLLTNRSSNYTFGFGGFGPIALTLDAFGNPVIAESLNRVGFYFHAIGSNSGNCPDCSGNAANYFTRFSPGMLATLKPSKNSSFGSITMQNTQVPVPTTLGDIQVLVGGIPAPLLYVSPSQINLQIPSSLSPGSNLVEFDVNKVSTAQTLAAWLFRIDPYSPGLFTVDASGSGPLLALNEDNSINDSGHPAKAGHVIQLFGTGQGFISTAPPDGQPPSGLVSTPLVPRVLINGFDATVNFSGLAPNFVGTWQINAVVPSNVPIGKVTVVVLMNDVPSSVDPFTGKINQVTINVTQ